MTLPLGGRDGSSVPMNTSHLQDSPNLDKEVAALRDGVTSPPGNRHLWSWDLDLVCLSPRLFIALSHHTQQRMHPPPLKKPRSRQGVRLAQGLGSWNHSSQALGACQAAHTWEDKTQHNKHPGICVHTRHHPPFSLPSPLSAQVPPGRPPGVLAVVRVSLAPGAPSPDTLKSIPRMPILIAS